MRLRSERKAERRRLRAKYLRLGLGELSAALVFCLVGALDIAPELEARSVWALWSALAPLLAVLVVGGTFWLTARVWVTTTSMPRWLARTYAGLGVLNALLLALGLVGVVLMSKSPWLTAGLLAVWAFGLVEFVNYFVVRLAYPAGSWFGRVRRRQRPRLVTDMREALSAD